jgi:hypothetical protein
VVALTFVTLSPSDTYFSERLYAYPEPGDGGHKAEEAVSLNKDRGDVEQQRYGFDYLTKDSDALLTKVQARSDRFLKSTFLKKRRRRVRAAESAAFTRSE